MSAGVGDITNLQSRIYQMDPALFAGLRRSMIVRMAVISPLLLAVIWYMDGRVEPRRDVFDFVAAPAILAWTLYRSIQRERKKWGSLSLQFKDGILIRRLPDFPTLEIAPDEVTKIVESARGLALKTNSRLKYLFVNRGLRDYDDFRSRLAVWATPAEVVRAARSIPGFIKSMASILLCVALFGGPLYLMYTPYKQLILPLGIVLIIGFIGMILFARRSPDIPISLRKAIWILLALPLLTLIFRLSYQ